MKYIVYWVLFKIIPLECPDIKQDKFGIYPSTNCLVFHFKTVKEQHDSIFINKDEAVAFYNEAIKKQNKFSNLSAVFNHNIISDVKIDSVKFKK